ncbi:MAG: SPOR domain-containing protein [Bacteroidetes bacterium]|nr:SPOR domain-containing protein [Bacteroidota bacterium]
MQDIVLKQINDIIYDTLARRCSVYIENIGSLVLSSDNETLNINNKTQLYPIYKVVIVKEKRFGIDLKSHILSISNIDKKNVDTFFDEWKTICKITNSLENFNIENVLNCENNIITLSSKLNKTLNPLSASVDKKVKVSVKKSKSSNKKALIITAIFFGLVIVGMEIVKSGAFVKKAKITKVKITKRKPIVEKKAMDTTIVETITPEIISNEQYHVVVGSFNVQANALNYAEKLTSNNTNADVLSMLKRHYVTVGTFLTEDEAIKKQRKIGIVDSWVLHIKDGSPIYKKN